MGSRADSRWCAVPKAVITSKIDYIGISYSEADTRMY